MKKKNNKIENFFGVMSHCVYVPMGIFPNINIHTNINCHLKI